MPLAQHAAVFCHTRGVGSLTLILLATTAVAYGARRFAGFVRSRRAQGHGSSVRDPIARVRAEVDERLQREARPLAERRLVRVAFLVALPAGRREEVAAILASMARPTEAVRVALVHAIAARAVVEPMGTKDPAAIDARLRAWVTSWVARDRMPVGAGYRGAPRTHSREGEGRVLLAVAAAVRGVTPRPPQLDVETLRALASELVPDDVARMASHDVRWVPSDPASAFDDATLREVFPELGG